MKEKGGIRSAIDRCEMSDILLGHCERSLYSHFASGKNAKPGSDSQIQVSWISTDKRRSVYRSDLNSPEDRLL
jgi:hypothetical protein